MASGMGVVISNKINGHSDVLVDGGNCFIVEPEKKVFVKAISNYIDQPDLFKIHADINRKKIEPLSIIGTAKFMFRTLENLDIIK